MGPTEQIAHADETLKKLLERFREDPQGKVFGELGEALLVRGHAQEALQVSEHGLQHSPDSCDGRVLRASALLELQRPKVAYLELCRALAVDPDHQKALRLLGKVYVAAGAPERAAMLLRGRRRAPTPPRSVPPAALAPQGPMTDDLPELLEALREDIGVDEVPKDFADTKIEITHVVRNKGALLPHNLLRMIDGPIVDTTRATTIVGVPSEPPPDNLWAIPATGSVAPGDHLPLQVLGIPETPSDTPPPPHAHVRAPRRLAPNPVTGRMEIRQRRQSTGESVALAAIAVLTIAFLLTWALWSQPTIKAWTSRPNPTISGD